LVASADHHDTAGEVEPNAHGDGPLQISINTWFTAGVTRPLLKAVESIGNRFFFNLDLNAGDTVGFGARPSAFISESRLTPWPGWLQSTIGNGARSSAATSYLASADNNGNLDVLLNTEVTRVLPSGGTSDFRTVEFIPSGKGLATVENSQSIDADIQQVHTQRSRPRRR
jgi:choline dehydrogenase-like flavoprotein